MKNRRKNEERRKDSNDPFGEGAFGGVQRSVQFVDRRGKQRHTNDEVQILLVTASTLTMISMTLNEFNSEELVALANELVRMTGFDPDAFFQSEQFRRILARHWKIPT